MSINLQSKYITWILTKICGNSYLIMILNYTEKQTYIFDLKCYTTTF